MTVIKCIGKDAVQRDFVVRHIEDPFFGTLRFFVRPLDESPQDEFELVLAEEDSGVMRVKVMNNYGLECYSRKGIPESLLIFAATSLERTIESSPGFAPGGQWRTAEATKVWERLKDAGKATYNPETDTYSTVV